MIGMIHKNFEHQKEFPIIQSDSQQMQKKSINFDEDCEELSPAMMKAFKSAVVQRNRNKKA